MEDKNYLDISTAVRGQFIYRIVSVERLLQLFQTQQNTLIKPKKWDDPFENFILQSQVRIPTGEIATFGFRDQFYGQCWTLHSASDAMWRIYSPNKNAVRIRSTIQCEANPEFRTVLNWNFRHNFHDVERRLCREEVEVHGRADRVCAEAG